MTRISAALCAALLVLLALGGGATQKASAGTGDFKTYMVVFDGQTNADGTYAVESTYAVLCSYAVGGSYAVTGQYAVGCDYAVTSVYAVYAVAQKYAVGLVGAAGGTVVNDMLQQTGTMIVQSASPTFAEALRGYAVVDEVAEDHRWKAYPTLQEGIARGQLALQASCDPANPQPGCPNPDPQADPLEPLQWNMERIQAREARAIQAGAPQVEVGILDTGIDGGHLDFADAGGPVYSGPVPVSNVNCAKGKDFVLLVGPGLGDPLPCRDNNFHGTHVAGIVGARANGLGVVGVAPNIELIPVKVCDTEGYCYASSTAAAITYAGDMKFEVINMSFFVDDNEFRESHQFKCMSDPQQRAFRKANERAIQYARKQGVTPVAALGNSDTDLAHKPEHYEGNCEVVPAETEGVIGTMALGPENEKAYYSSYGIGATDVAAPGGNPEFIEELCVDEVFSTIPGNLYGCFSGTSMASPHTAGVAALIVSQFGTIGKDGDVVMSPTKVEEYLQSTTVDQGLPGYDECFGNGRINALRAVTRDTGALYDPTAPYCEEYED
jgi:lantibiotic leader peptide-processing serine protease